MMTTNHTQPAVSAASLDSFLQTHSTTGTTISHTSMTGGKYNIPVSCRKEFHNLLAKACFAEKQSVSLVERHGESGPIVVDLDIEYVMDTATPIPRRVYEGEALTNFLQDLVSAISSIVSVPEDRKTRLLYVFERGEPYQKGVSAEGAIIWKDGLHIMLPNVITSPHAQKIIRAEVLPELVHVIHDFNDGYTVVNSKEDIYDKSVIDRNGWLMYGCHKPKKTGYKLTQIWHADPNNLHRYTGSDIAAYSEIYTELACWDTGQFERYMGTDTGAANFVDKLSIRGYVAADECAYTDYYESQTKKEGDSYTKEFNERKKNSPWMTRCSTQDISIDFVAELLAGLSVSRAESYEEWSQLGWCLHNIHNDPDDDVLLAKWIAFSQQSRRHTDADSVDSCTRHWENCRTYDDNRPKLHLGSLKRWAHADNPEAYNKARQTCLDELILTCCNKYMPKRAPTMDPKGNEVEQQSRPKDWDGVCYYLVEVLYKYYQHDIVCSSHSLKIWWEFKNHRWTDNTIGLRNVLSVDVNALFENFATEQGTILKNMGSKDSRRSEHERLRNAARGVAEHTRNTLSKKKILSEAAERFFWSYRTQDKLHERQFEEVLDRNLYLVGLENGVYDLNAHHFRHGCCEDYVSRNTGNLWYEPTDRWNDPKVKAIMKFVSQVLPDKSIHDYALTLLASFCDGKIQEKFHIFVGCGGNGKSKLIDLFTNAMGHSGEGRGYCGNLPVTALTGKQGSSSGPSPEFARLKGMRFVVVQEPGQKETIQVGRLKELTGGDTIQARALHKEPVEFKPQFGMVLVSNVLPAIPGDDGGVWRRMRVVRFNSKFKDVPDPTDKNEFPIDLDLSAKLHDWGPAFFWILMQYYRVFREGDDGAEPLLQYATEDDERAPSGLRRCLFVDKETQRYRSRNDKFNTFLKLNVNENPANASTAELHLEVIWTRYTQYCKEHHVVPTMDELQDALELRYDIMQDDGFRGWRKIALWSEAEKDARFEKKAKPKPMPLPTSPNAAGLVPGTGN